MRIEWRRPTKWRAVLVLLSAGAVLVVVMSVSHSSVLAPSAPAGLVTGGTSLPNQADIAHLPPGASHTTAGQPASNKSKSLTNLAQPQVLFGTTSPDLSNVETAVGRKMVLVRIYDKIGQSVLSSQAKNLLGSGHILLLSIAPHDTNGNAVPLNAIASGQYDSYFVTQFAAMNNFATTPYFIFDHEPENATQSEACSGKSNCGAEFIGAWQHLHNLAATHGDRRIRWVWNIEGYTFRSNISKATSYYPGSSYVDVVGADIYPTTCDAKGGTQSFATQSQAVLNWHAQHAADKPIFIPEWGAPSSSDSLRSTYFAQMAATLQTAAYAPVQGIVYFNSIVNSKCDWRLDTSAPSFAAFKAMANNPYFERTQ